MVDLSSDAGQQLSMQGKKVCQVLRQAFLNSKSHGKSSALEIIPQGRGKQLFNGKARVTQMRQNC